MDFAHPSRSRSTRQRAAGLAAALVLHAAMVSLLLRMGSGEGLTPELPPLQLALLERPRPKPTELPPVQSHLRVPPPQGFPLPSIVIEEPAQLPVVVAAVVVPTATPTLSAASAGVARPSTSIRPGGFAGMTIGDIGTRDMVRAKMDKTRSPDSCYNPAFPAAVNHNAYGMAAVSLLIGPDGSVRDSRIDRSSGEPLLDQATIDSFARCTYIRGTIGGIPAPTWYRIKWLWFLSRSERGGPVGPFGEGSPRRPFP